MTLMEESPEIVYFAYTCLFILAVMFFAWCWITWSEMNCWHRERIEREKEEHEDRLRREVRK